MDNPPCEVIQQQSQRYSHRSNGGAERMVQTTRNQLKACKTQMEKNWEKHHPSRQSSAHLVATTRSTEIHAIPLTTRLNNHGMREDPTHVLPKPNPTRRIGEAVACRRPGALVNKMESAWLEGVWLGRDSRTDEHLFGTPNGVVRSRVLKGTRERRRWDTTLLNPWFGPHGNRFMTDKFNLATDDENIDFNISGVPDATVKRSQSISVHDLIQRIESHPQKEAIQNDLEQHQSFNPFSDESKVAIMAAGNTELCEIINVEPKWQCKVCLKHCSTGIIYCTCGHLMTNDSAENRKYISAILDSFPIPNFYIRKGRPHGHKYGKAPGCKDYFTANQLAKKCRKK